MAFFCKLFQKIELRAYVFQGFQVSSGRLHSTKSPHLPKWLLSRGRQGSHTSHSRPKVSSSLVDASSSYSFVVVDVPDVRPCIQMGLQGGLRRTKKRKMLPSPPQRGRGRKTKVRSTLPDTTYTAKSNFPVEWSNSDHMLFVNRANFFPYFSLEQTRLYPSFTFTREKESLVDMAQLHCSLCLFFPRTARGNYHATRHKNALGFYSLWESYCAAWSK